MESNLWFTAYYSVSTGKLDCSDSIELEIELTPEQAAAYKRAVMTGKDAGDVPELEPVLDETYKEAEENELSILTEIEDEYTMECLGLNKVDPGEINDLVHGRDPHAIRFFHLEKLSDEELEKWDANELDELPKVADFDESFVPDSPFNQGWNLHVYLSSDDKDWGSAEAVKEYLREALIAGDYALVDEVVEANSYYSPFKEETIESVVYKLAIELGLEDYARERWGDTAE